MRKDVENRRSNQLTGFCCGQCRGKKEKRSSLVSRFLKYLHSCCSSSVVSATEPKWVSKCGLLCAEISVHTLRDGQEEEEGEKNYLND